MINKITPGTIVRGFFAMVFLSTSLNGYAIPAKEHAPVASPSLKATQPAKEPAFAPEAKHPPSVTSLLKEKDKQLVKEAGEAVAETRNALDALERNNPKEALADLEVVSGKLHAVLAKDTALKEVPIDADAVIVNFVGNLDLVREAAKKARDLIEAQQLQAARQILDQLVSEIRISVTSLPLEVYPKVIEKTASLIVAGNIDEAKAQLNDLLNLLVTKTEIYPLPVLAAEENLTEAFRLEHTADLTKEEQRKRISNLADETNKHLELAEALGYGTKDDYPTLYQGIKALKETVHTNNFQTEWDKLHKSLLEFKDRLVHPAK
jgi:hypothetical protein